MDLRRCVALTRSPARRFDRPAPVPFVVEHALEAALAAIEALLCDESQAAVRILAPILLNRPGDGAAG